MNKTLKMDYLFIALILVVVIASQHTSDPIGIARRNPTSIHAHQGQWPASCADKSSHQQSPIMIDSTLFHGNKSSDLKTDFKAERADLLDIGHSFQLRLGSAISRISFEGKSYHLKQFHFHKPAEHIIDGKQFDMEIHFVFTHDGDSRNGNKAMVLGFPVVEGADHPEITKIWRYLPPFKEGYGENTADVLDWEQALATNELETSTLDHQEQMLKKDLSIDFQRIIPTTSHFYIYDGSLTTPPCDEGITHAVASVPIVMGHEQIEHFEGYYEGSNRDIQPIGDVALRNFRKGQISH